MTVDNKKMNPDEEKMTVDDNKMHSGEDTVLVK